MRITEIYLIAPEKLTFKCILDYFESRVIFLQCVFHLEGNSRGLRLIVCNSGRCPGTSAPKEDTCQHPCFSVVTEALLEVSPGPFKGPRRK